MGLSEEELKRLKKTIESYYIVRAREMTGDPFCMVESDINFFLSTRQERIGELEGYKKVSLSQGEAIGKLNKQISKLTAERDGLMNVLVEHELYEHTE